MDEAAKKTILFLVNDADFFLSHRLNLAIEARNSGLRVIVSCPDDGKIADILRKNSLQYYKTYPVRTSHNAISNIRIALSYFQAIRMANAAIVHLITSKPIIIGGIIARIMRIPTISAVSGLGFVFTSDSRHSWLSRRIVATGYKLALNWERSWVIFQNAVDRDLFGELGITRKAYTTLFKGSGVDLARIRPHAEPESPITILLPARILRDKGVSEFVEAARLVRATRPDTRFRIQGKIDRANPTSFQLEDIRAWSEEGLVEVAEHTDDVDAMLAAAHIVVLPSYREGFPKTLVDAAAAGRPVVTTDAPGCRDAIVPGKTGLLVPVRDASSLADAIATLIDDPALRRRMGQSARLHAEQYFDVRAITNQHLALYRQVLQS